MRRFRVRGGGEGGEGGGFGQEGPALEKMVGNTSRIEGRATLGGWF